MKNKTIKLITIAALSATMIGCGGGGGGGNGQPPQGRFADSTVEGLGYATTPSGRSGKTSENGAYNFTAGDVVTFSLSNIDLGTATATTATLFPKDIVSTSEKAAQIAQLLQNLDADRDADNGIDLSNVKDEIDATNTAIIEAVLTDSNADFSDANTNLLTEEPITATFITRAAAVAHVQETLQCEHSGGYRGKYISTTVANGVHTPAFDFPDRDIGFLVNTDGTVQGYFDDDGDNAIGIIAKSAPIDFTRDAFTFTTTDAGGAVSGTFSDTNNLSGTVVDSSGNTGATFTASRIGGAINAKYRFTGAFAETAESATTHPDESRDYGVFVFDINDNNTITGRSYSVSYDKLQPIASGSITGEGNTRALTARINSTDNTHTTARATINLDTGAITNATWASSPPGNFRGIFEGSGCQLN